MRHSYYPTTLGSVVKVVGSWEKGSENAESVKKSPTGRYSYRQDIMAITTRRMVGDVSRSATVFWLPVTCETTIEILYMADNNQTFLAQVAKIWSLALPEELLLEKNSILLLVHKLPQILRVTTTLTISKWAML